jgi:hypothetical protein
LLVDLYDPASPRFRQFLSPEEFTRRFGPTEQDYARVIAFMRANDLKVNSTSPNRVVLNVEGSVSDVERAFGVSMQLYRHPKEPRDFFAPDTEPSVPSGLPVADMWGLSDFARPRPMSRRVTPVHSAPLNYNGTGPGGSYRGADFRRAYAAGSSLTGAGQVVALAQFDGYYQSDITTYLTQANYALVPLQNILLDGVSGTPGYSGISGAVAEVSMDIELAIAMAPGLSKVMVYEGSSPYTVFNRIATDNAAKQVSCSWLWNTGPSHKWSVGRSSTLDSILSQMVAQGQAFFQASGDSDAYTGADALSTVTGPIPVDSIYVTSVGGTTLTMTSFGSVWLSETVWNWGNNTGSSGGVSTYYSIPYWQTNVSMTANSGSTTKRNIPDVAMTADAVYVIYNNGTTGYFGGTSCAAPLWAGFCALVNQQSTANSGAAVGFLNPALYAIAAGANYATCFHDTKTGNNIGSNTPGLYYAVTNYDLATGLGTPNGVALINALAPSPPQFLTQPTGQTVTNGANVILSATATGSLPFSYQWLRAGTNLPAGGNVSGVNSNVLSITSATTNNSGNYQLVVANSAGSVTSSIASVTVGFAPAIAEQPASQSVFSGSNAVFAASVAGSTPLVFQWRKNGTNLVDGPGISGATSNILTLIAVTTNSAGNYSLHATNSFGSVTSAAATLSVSLNAPSLLLASSANPAGYHDSLTFSATILPTNATGTIEFRTNGAAFDLRALSSGTAVSTNLPSLPRGTNTVAAIYSGDIHFLPATNTMAQIITNHPPVAASFFCMATAGLPLEILLADLAANWTDPDGDLVQLAGFGVSTNGITLTNTGTALVYYNTNSLTDQFTCTIADDFGGTNFQTVDIEVEPPPNLTPLITGVVPTNSASILLELAGAPGFTYVLEASVDLTTAAAWSPIATNTVGTNGLWQYTDHHVAEVPQRFFRLKLLP